LVAAEQRKKQTETEEVAIGWAQETNCDLCCGNWRQKAAHPPGPGHFLPWTRPHKLKRPAFGSVKESGGRTKRQPPVHNETALLLFLEFL
jgi:hypothetical protein